MLGLKKWFLPPLFILLLLCKFASAAEELIAYSHLTDGYWQIWVMSAEGGSASGGTPTGSQQRQVTFSKIDKRDPAWLNEDKIAYRTNNGQLFIVDLKDNNETEILARFKNINNPNFCPQTQELVFVRFDPRSADISGIWKTDLDGNEPVLLTREKSFAYQPVFSAQGDKIAFVKADPNIRENHHLWLMSLPDGWPIGSLREQAGAEGRNPIQLTNGHGFYTLPHFSPDGKYLTLTSNRNGDYEIYLLEIDSQKIIPLTQNPGLDTTSSFSPDGEKIVFVSNRSGNQQIWVMSLPDGQGSASGGGKDGSNSKQLTFGEEESIDPAWGK